MSDDLNIDRLLDEDSELEEISKKRGVNSLSIDKLLKDDEDITEIKKVIKKVEKDDDLNIYELSKAMRKAYKEKNLSNLIKYKKIIYNKIIEFNLSNLKSINIKIRKNVISYCLLFNSDVHVTTLLIKLQDKLGIDIKKSISTTLHNKEYITMKTYTKEDNLIFKFDVSY